MDYAELTLSGHQLYSGIHCLNMTKVEIKLVLDADMYLFFEKVLRDGISYISEG